MNNDLEYESIRQKFVELLRKRFGVTREDINKGDFDKELLGKSWGLAARDLVYIFFDIEKEFGITIPQKDVTQGRFNTFNNIIEIICNQLEKETKESA